MGVPPKRPPPRRGPGSLASLLALVSLAFPAVAAPPEPRDGAARISSRAAASEHWDLVARFESGHRLFARFLITNEGPGELSALAFGQLVLPDGRVVPFHNGRRQGRWELSHGGRRIRIASSVLDQTGRVRKFEYDSNRRGLKVHLWFEPARSLRLPDDPALGGYSSELLDPAAPVRGTLWMTGMEAPLELEGTLAATHAWMERSESELVWRQLEFFSLDRESALYLSDLTTPKGLRSRSLAVYRGGELLHQSQRFQVELAEGPRPSPAYPVPAALRVRSPALEGEIRVGEVLLEHDPIGDLPQPFRFLLSFRYRPRRVWMDASFELKLAAAADRPERVLGGAGIATALFLNPRPAGMPDGPVAGLRARARAR